MSMKSRNFINVIVEAIQSQISYQDDPKNRVVTRTYTKSDDPILYRDIYAVTDCGGWAEKEFFVTRTYRSDDGHIERNMVGHTEAEVKEWMASDSNFPLKIALERLFAFPEWDTLEPWEDGVKYAHNLSSIPEKLEALVSEEASTTLVTETGDCNWAMIRRLNCLGYNVYAGDKDSFGWLTGCIEQDGKVLVYDF